MPLSVPIFMYHEVGAEEDMTALHSLMQRNYLTSLETFRRHLEILRDEGATPVTLDHFRAWQTGAAELPLRPVVITFDDGYAGNHHYAVPMLREFGFTATFFVISGRVGTAHMMSWNQLREIASAGMEIGSHTWSHPLLSQIDAATTSEELRRSRRELEDGLGAPINHFALPFGDINTHYRQAMEESGYATGCTSVVGINTRKTDPFMLRRFAVTTAVSDLSFASLVRCESRVIRKILLVNSIKRGLARVIGRRNYERLGNLRYGVKLLPGTRPQ